VTIGEFVDIEGGHVVNPPVHRHIRRESREQNNGLCQSVVLGEWIPAKSANGQQNRVRVVKVGKAPGNTAPSGEFILEKGCSLGGLQAKSEALWALETYDKL
jgi:hypothetical protein